MKISALPLLVLLTPMFVASTFSHGERFTLQIKGMRPHLSNTSLRVGGVTGQGSFEHPVNDHSRTVSSSQQTNEWPRRAEIGGRRLRQSGNGTALCTDAIEELYDETREAYVLEEEDVSRLIDVTNCVNDSATVIVEVSEVSMEESIVIDHSVTIVGRPPPGSSNYKVHIQCPDIRTGVFDIRNGNVVLENFVIHGCNQESGDPPVVVTGNTTHCSLVDVDFLNNKHSVAEATIRARFEEDDDFTVSLKRVNLFGNEAPLSGVASFSASTILEDVNVEENSARDGILLFSENSNITITNLNATDNKATVLAIHENSGLFLDGSVFAGNGQETESGDGGAINAENVEATIRGTAFVANRAAFGGAIFAKSSTIDINKTHFKMNRAREGGACYLEDSDSTFRHGNFTLNSASNDGGAFWVEDGALIITHHNFTRNNVTNTGACMHAVGMRTLKLKHSTFAHNSGKYAGVGRIENTALIAYDCRFTDNSALNAGGCFYFDRGNGSKLLSSTMSRNTAVYGGGIFCHDTHDTEIRNMEFQDNSATASGGACHYDIGSVTQRRVLFKNNNGGALGGGQFFYDVDVNGSRVTYDKNRAAEGGAFKGINARISFYPPSDSETNDGSSKPNIDSGFFGIWAMNNTADSGGGVIDIADTILTIYGGHFEDNSGIEGGVIHAWKNHINLTVLNSVFKNNKAETYGGAVFARAVAGGAVMLSFANVSFDRNSAYIGGSCLLYSTTSRFENCSFKKCHSRNRGGAIFFPGVPVNVASSVIINSKFLENRAEISGGGICSYNTSINISASSFIHNEAMTGDGGGIFASDHPILDLKEVRFEKNSAKDGSGGGLQINNSNLNAADCAIVDSSASGDGGGIWLSRSNATMDRLQFKRNKASGAGGGLLVDTNSSVNASGLNFSENYATDGGGLQTDSRSFVQCLECHFDRNEASKTGGGINIKTISECLNIDVNRTVFRNNSANYGGGIHVWNEFRNGEELGCRRKSGTDCKRRPVTISGSNFVDNRARRNGSSIHSNERKILGAINSHFDIDGTVLYSDDYPEHESCFPAVGVGPKKNALQDDSGVVSTYVSSFNVSFVGSSAEMLEDGTVRLSKDFVSGNRLPVIDLMPTDQFGQFPAAIDGSFRATLSAERMDEGNGELLKVAVTASKREDGSWRFETPVTERVKAGVYRLRIDFGNSRSLDSINLEVHTRSCTIDEERYEKEEVAGPYCRTCEADEYSLAPEDACSRCPENVDCRGKHVFAKTGHWLRSPFHTLPSACLNREACSGEISLSRSNSNSSSPKAGTSEEDVRIENLLDFIQGLEATKPDDLDEDDRRSFSQFSCHAGYEGVLCGDCSPGYGQTSNHRCRKCSNNGIAVIIVLSFLLFTTVIVAVTIKGNALRAYFSESMEIVLKRHSLETASRSASDDFHKSISDGENPPYDSTSDIDDEEQEVYPYTVRAGTTAARCPDEGSSSQQMVTVQLDGPMEEDQPEVCQTQTEQASGLVDGKDAEQCIVDAQFAKWRICEILKTLLNFLQAIAVAAIINVEWTREITTLFRIADVASGSSVDAISNSVYCLSEQWGIRRSFWSSVGGMAGPFSVVLIFVVFYSGHMRNERKRFSYLFRKVTLSFLALLYFSYLTITKQTLLVLNCIKVHEIELKTETVTTYWAQDTGLECFTSYHSGLFALAIAFLAVFVVGFPVISAIMLWNFSRKGQLGFTGILYDVMGFMYRGYDPRHCYWESLVMLRKACFSVIAVFSYSLRGTTQGLLASLVNVLCLFAHTMVRPYREELGILNNLEALSLIFSCITFLLSSFFFEGLASGPVRRFMTLGLILLIVGFVLFMSVVLVYSAVDYVTMGKMGVSMSRELIISFYYWMFQRGYKIHREENGVEMIQASVRR